MSYTASHCQEEGRGDGRGRRKRGRRRRRRRRWQADLREKSGFQGLMWGQSSQRKGRSMWAEQGDTWRRTITYQFLHLTS